MAEIQREPQTLKTPEGGELKVFDENHTFADVVRWIISEGGAEEAHMFLSEHLGK
jgi:DNA-directed RNA polymerase subunit L